MYFISQNFFKEIEMSVRSTSSLIGDAVVTTGIKGPKMVVQAVDEEKKLVTTVWFADNGLAQTAVFPAAALDRSDVPVKPAAASAAKKTATGTGRRGRPPRK
jgi:hypothetical protein